MTEVEVDQLKRTVENMHGGTATLAQSVPVRETFEGKTVWEGVVHVFDLARPSDCDTRLRMERADREEHEAAIFCRAAY